MSLESGARLGSAVNVGSQGSPSWLFPGFFLILTARLLSLPSGVRKLPSVRWQQICQERRRC